MADNFKMIAKTLWGLEEILVEELRALGAQHIENGNRLVSFKGDKGFMYKANLCLATALRILKPIYKVRVKTPEELYKLSYDFPWKKYLGAGNTFVVDSVVSGTYFNHSQYVSQRVKDGLVDRFRDEIGKRPSVNFNTPDLRIHIHIQNDLCSISLDSSGTSLHQRGYRKATNIAPLNEVLAAGLVRLSRWNGKTNFLDPMCGSGTLLIEAAQYVSNIPANINRKFFAFQKWNDWDADLFQKIRESATRRVVKPEISITGYDKAPSAVSKALLNVKSAGLADLISVERTNFFETKKEGNAPLFLLTNPPYGERLKGNIEEMYGKMGSTLKHAYTHTDAWVLSSNVEALKHIGLRTKRKIKLFNGKLEARLCHFPIYEGSKKTKK